MSWQIAKSGSLFRSHFGFAESMMIDQSTGAGVLMSVTRHGVVAQADKKRLTPEIDGSHESGVQRAQLSRDHSQTILMITWRWVAFGFRERPKERGIGTGQTSREFRDSIMTIVFREQLYWWKAPYHMNAIKNHPMFQRKIAHPAQ
jgi:hypothetical protein